MTKAKQLTLAAANTDVDPRVRMKEVREEVKMFVNGGGNPWGIAHLGELYTDEADRTRLIIALQDLYDDRASRHNAASAHVADLIQRLEGEMESSNFLMNENMRLHTLAQHNYDEWAKAYAANQELQKRIKLMEHQDRKLEAALLTLYTVMEG